MSKVSFVLIIMLFLSSIMLLGVSRQLVRFKSPLMSLRSGSGISEFSANKARVALCQIKVGSDKESNIEIARDAMKRAKVGGAELIILPECWNCPYSTASFPTYAEIVPPSGFPVNIQSSPSISMLCSEAKALGTWVVGGSVPERDGDKLYNTCIIANPEGQIVGKHRKVHLFDIDVPGKIRFKESDALSGGSSLTVVDTPWGKVGVGICYDIRFPELSIVMRKEGCKIMVFPGAFNMVTGPAHWELLQRARAVDNQVFVATCSPARDSSAGYIAWGHSMVVNPWGEVIASATEKEEVIFADLDMEKVGSVRESVPYWTQKRHDVYSDIELKSKL